MLISNLAYTSLVMKRQHYVDINAWKCKVKLFEAQNSRPIDLGIFKETFLRKLEKLNFVNKFFFQK